MPYFYALIGQFEFFADNIDFFEVWRTQSFSLSAFPWALWPHGRDRCADIIIGSIHSSLPLNLLLGAPTPAAALPGASWVDPVL